MIEKEKILRHCVEESNKDLARAADFIEEATKQRKEVMEILGKLGNELLAKQLTYFSKDREDIIKKLHKAMDILDSNWKKALCQK